MNKSTILITLLSLGLVSCLKSGSGSSVPTITDGVTLTGQLGLTSSKGLYFATSLDQFEMECNTVEEIPRTVTETLSSNGGFSITLPRNKPFSCAFKDTTGSVSYPLVLKSEKEGFQSSETDTLDLSSGVSMGSIPLNLETGKVEVEPAIIEKAKNSQSSSILFSFFHNTNWKMSCLDSADLGCAEFIADNEEDGGEATVFFRHLQATNTDSTVVNGMSVWRDESSFTNCGAIDFTTAEAAGIESEEGFTWTKVSTAATYVEIKADCPLQDETDTIWSKPTVGNYLAAGPAQKIGKSFVFTDEEEEENTSGCLRTHSTTVFFTPLTNNVLIGKFNQNEVVLNKTSGGCGADDEVELHNFMVKFTKI